MCNWQNSIEKRLFNSILIDRKKALIAFHVQLVDKYACIVQFEYGKVTNEQFDISAC